MNKFQKRYEEWGFPQKDDIYVKTCIRVNTNLISPKKLKIRLEENNVTIEPVSFLQGGFYADSSFPLSSTIEYLLGYFYIQEAPAQVPGEIIKDEIKNKLFDNLKILDLCAAPGGKTTHIAECLRNKGQILAYDNNEERLKKLCYNLERMRVTNTSVYNKETEILDQKFDIILLDAPCSGNFTQDEDWLFKRNFSDFKNRQKLQKELIKKAYLLLKSNGVLIYSTCSLEKEENEEVIEFILDKAKDLLVEPIHIKANPGLTQKTKNCLRFWPNQDKQPGFFIAKLRKIK